MRTRLLLATLVLPAALATACGEDSGDTARDASASATTESPGSPEPSGSAGPAAAVTTEPQCADVWSAGATLPGGYRECYEGDRRVRAEERYCEFGKPLVTYDSRFYSVRGGRIAEADRPFVRDPGYQDVLRKCSG